MQDIRAATIEGGDIAAALAAADVVVFSTGAEAAAAMARPGTVAIKYRHTPDPGDFERVVVPFMTTASQQVPVERKEAS